jgi:hypothetical protein
MSNRKQQNIRGQKRTRTHAFLYGFSAVCVIIAALVAFAQRSEAGVHPDPRANAAELLTASPDQFAAWPEIKETYKLAAQVKPTLDGLFCYCHCKGAGHYSLLDCFRDDHGAGCDICLESARIAYRMVNEGKTLEEIRLVLDQTYGTRG